MNEENIKLEMRLAAMEYFIAKICVGVAKANGVTEQAFVVAADKMIAEAGNQIIPGLDPAKSDYASAEWQEAVERLLKMQKEMVARG